MGERELQIKGLEEWSGAKDRPFIVSGPCSAEDPDQLLNTVKGVAATANVNLLRAGIWKPRTRPNAFEGRGQVALSWLKEAGDEVGLPVCCEVANSQHVEACLKEGIDVLWIGARTTVSPFAVQEIAEAVKGTDIPVMVKNPINPDIQLWIGALERLNAAGIEKLVAIHRGFSSFSHSKLRNAPMWEYPIELKIQFPNLPILCDPSHIAGKSKLVFEVAQKAMDLDMDGLMVEVHEDPENALSDAAQQLTPTELEALIHRLVVRKNRSTNLHFANRLAELRAQIDLLDEQVIQKISSRMQVAEKIGAYKKDNNVTILQLERWEQIIRERTNWGENIGLSEDFMRAMLQLIHQESIRIQTLVMNQKGVSESLDKSSEV